MTRIPVPNDCDLQPVETVPIKKEEAREQARLVAALRHCWHLLPDERRPVIAHIPNGGGRSKAQGALLKATGTSPGVPDLMLPTPRGKHHGLFVEMKRTKGGRISAEQKDWIAYLQANGYRAIVCHGFEEAKKEIECYLSTTS